MKYQLVYFKQKVKIKDRSMFYDAINDCVLHVYYNHHID